MAFELSRGTFVYWHDRILHLSLLFPSGWTTNTLGDIDESGGDAHAPGDENTFCLMMPQPMTGDLESTANGYWSLVGTFDTWMQFARPVDTRVGGLPAVMTREYPKSGLQTGGEAFESLNYVVGLNDTWAYSIACQTSLAKYREWEPKFEAIVHSLTLDK